MFGFCHSLYAVWNTLPGTVLESRSQTYLHLGARFTLLFDDSNDI